MSKELFAHIHLMLDLFFFWYLHLRAARRQSSIHQTDVIQLQHLSEQARIPADVTLLPTNFIET